jgi:hypothetical protein
MPRFIAVISTLRLLFHGSTDPNSKCDPRICLQADGTHKTNLHRMPALIIGKKIIISIILSFMLLLNMTILPIQKFFQT